MVNIPLFIGFQPSKVVQDFATIHSRTQVRYIEVVQWGKLSQVATGGTILTDTWSLNVLTSHWAGFDDPFINQGFGIGSRIFVLSRERERISQCSNLGAAQNVARVLAHSDVCFLDHILASGFPIFKWIRMCAV